VRLHSIHARPFLEAFQQNARITTVHLVCLRLTAIDVATLLDNSSSLSTFRLQSCAAESQEAAAAIAAALERNTTIETLELKVLSTPLLVAILERLRHNGSVKKLMYSNYWDILGNSEEPLALEALLTSTPTIEELQIVESRFNAVQFQPICQGLVQSQSVSTLHLAHCYLRGQEFNPLFQALLRTKLNLHSLRANDCNFESGNFYDSLLEHLSWNDSPLKCLSLSTNHVYDDNFDFSGLLRAVGQGNLDSFSIGTVYSAQRFQILVDSIPSMKIRELGLGSNMNDGTNRKQQLLDAVEQNFLLRSVTMTKQEWFGEHYQLNNVDKARLAFFSNRNEHFAAWTEKRSTVPAKLWPEALFMAQQDSKTSLFTSLKALAGSEEGLAKYGKRKRKRTTFFKPS